MIKILSVVLLAGAGLGQVYGQVTKPAAAGTVEALKQLEHDWSDAQKSANVARLSQILADDWSGLGMDGTKSTKQEFLNDIKSGTAKLQTFEFGPMDVKVLGTVAVVQGSDTEKSTAKGKDTSGKWVWTDVFVQRDGKWQAVRSQNSMVK
jgi:ketosteroid isomerase-like protein